MNNLEEIAQAIGRSKNALICGHVMPDGDSLGSALAMGALLELLGKDFVIAGPDPIPEIYGFLNGAERFHAGEPPEGPFDTLIVLDCSVPERLGRGYQELLASDMAVINIDHHASAVTFGTYRYVEPNAAAVGEIIFDIFKLMGLDISLEAAICLYTAIITDTGSFQYDNTTPGTLRRVAELMEIGVPASKVNILLNEERPRASLILLGAAISKISLSPCEKVCWMTVTREMLRNCGAGDEHTEGLVNYTRSLKGVQVGLVFRETLEGSYKISFRSKDSVDVNRLAAKFGGGGHLRAAGCVMYGDLSEIQGSVVAAAVEATGGMLP